MGMTRAMTKDAVQALVVLALAFFNFAHAPVSAATAYDAELRPYLLPSAAAFVDCGDEDDEGLAHTPCHACRIGGAADLPPAPECALAVSRMASAVAYPARTAPSATATPPHSGEPRAPPSV